MMKHRYAIWIVGMSAFYYGCGSSLPSRYVIEHDIDDHKYRRYQKMDHPELNVDNNPGQGHTAVYVDAQAHETAPIEDIKAWVSVYKSQEHLLNNVQSTLYQLKNYKVRKVSREGDDMFELIGVDGDRWVLWVSANYVIKLGGSTKDIPDEIIGEYLETYPSDVE